MAWFDEFNLPGATIDGYFGFIKADGQDEDDYPDVVLADGTVTFTATTEAARVDGAWLGIQPVTAQIFEGKIVISEEDPRPVRLLATDAPIGVADWAWKASFKVDGFRLNELTFRAPRDTTVNLTADLIPIKSQPYQIIEGASIVNTEVDTAGERMRFKMSDGTFTDWVNVPNGEPGAKGDPGDKGDPGSDGLSATLSMGAVSTGATADAWMTGTPTDRLLNLTLPRGQKGDKGDKGDGSSWAEMTGKPSSFPTSVPDVVGLAEALDSKQNVEPVELGTENLNGVTTPGFYYQTQSGEATMEANYPATAAGALNVRANEARTQVQQTYTTFLTSNPQRFWRTFYASTWSAWRKVVDGNDSRLSDARTPLSHTHTIAQVNGLQAALDAAGGTPSWPSVTDKPETFPPATHQHSIGDVSTLQAALDAKLNVAPVVLSGNGLDLNTYNTTMRAVITSNTWAANGLNFPDPTAGYLEVVNAPNGFVWQIYRTYSVGDPKFFIRTWWNSWGTWRMLVTDRHPALTDYRYPLAHQHEIANVNGLQAALDAAGTSEHTHPITEVEGLSAALASKMEQGDLDTALGGIASAYDVAVSDGFAGTVSEWLASLVGPRGEEGPYGGTAVTDPAVAQLVTDETDTQAALDARYQVAVRPVDYGAVGDGFADDTAAVQAVVATGRPVQWGSGTYRITAPLDTTLAGPLVWQSEGAAIVADFPTAQARMVSITANGHPVTITGRLTLDAARTAFSVFRAWNRGTASPAFVAEDLTVQNGYRSSTEHLGGDGIEVGGSWDRVALIRPTVKHQNLAVGAGISGQYGVGGIYVHDIALSAGGGADSPGVVRIEDPYIEDVQSEDPAYLVDQDAIKVFGGLANDADTTPMRSHATIIGGEVRNARGRAVKSQMEGTTVDGLRIVRTEGGKGGAHDIDFQVGGGTLRNLECLYIGAAPQSVVNFSGVRTGERTLPQRSVAGVKVLIQGGIAPDRIVSLISYQEVDFRVVVSDITVHAGDVHPAHIVRMSGTSGVAQRVVLSGVIAHASTACVAGQSGSPDGWDGTLVATGIINPGADRPLLEAATLARVAATASGLAGYTV